MFSAFFAAEMLFLPQRSQVCENQSAKPYCDCFKIRDPQRRLLNSCYCGEDVEVNEWQWQAAADCGPHLVALDEQQRQVTFHPLYSAGTAVVRGDTPFCRDHHYYWEVKMLTDTYGTDIMVGVGTDKVDTSGSRFKFTSLLGEDEQSYGMSYRGFVRHAAARSGAGPGFCRGTLIGVRVDMWQGTLEFYLNRKPQGICYYNLRRHQQLYPMLCSTAAQSTMRLTYAASWRASLLVDAAKILAESARNGVRNNLPPGLWKVFAPHFWLLMPSEDWLPAVEEKKPSPDADASSEMEVEDMDLGRALYADFPSPYVNGYYQDTIEPSRRLVVWENVVN